MRIHLVASLLSLGAVSACGVGVDENVADTEYSTNQSALIISRGWTQADVDAIERELVGEKPSNYRLTLPVFRGTSIVNSRTIGTMSVTDINVISTRLNQPVRTDAFMVAAKMCCGGSMCGASGGGTGSGGASGGNGGGSNDSPLAERLSRAVNPINTAQYQFLF